MLEDMSVGIMDLRKVTFKVGSPVSDCPLWSSVSSHIVFITAVRDFYSVIICTHQSYCATNENNCILIPTARILLLFL